MASTRPRCASEVTSGSLRAEHLLKSLRTAFAQYVLRPEAVGCRSKAQPSWHPACPESVGQLAASPKPAAAYGNGLEIVIG
jgi:hypothetical protein